MNSKIANEIFRYDVESGKLYWKIKPSKKVAIGAEIKGDHGKGYLGVDYKGKRYPVHRLIWLMAYGKFPDGHIDHEDHDRKNNRLNNLRDVSPSSNHRNRSIASNNTSGVLGVNFDKRYQKWRTQGRGSDGIQKHIGYFTRIEDAIEARKAFNRENGYHSNHGK